MMAIEHVPVLLQAVESYLLPLHSGDRLCDATLGGGGHTARLLELCPACQVVGIDADERMIAQARQRLGEREVLTIEHGWFDEVLGGLGGFDRILIDLGVSMVHLRDPERGFSFREDGPLDMRLNASSDEETAAELIQRVSETELADIIFQYGEERYSRRIARAIAADRWGATRSTAALAGVVRSAVPPAYRHGRNDPSTRTFQALRIAVNDELRRIERVIPLAATALNPGGRLLIISFHSLEDRIVKHAFRALGQRTFRDVNDTTEKMEESFTVITRKPVVPDEEERNLNPASRSAKLRVLEKNRR